MGKGKNLYYKQAELLLKCLPSIMKVDLFAIKGGTAINFFIRNVPRISVDIDLTYLLIEDREKTLETISKSLIDIKSLIQKISPKVKIFPKRLEKSNSLIGLIIQEEDATVKIEPNLILRGSIFPCENRDLAKEAQKLFEMFLIAKTVSFEELYGGKICAALDRQHPRDLFDLKILFENEGITEGIRKAFIINLISHNRPMHELLSPNFKDIKQIYESEFSGMTRIDVELDELIETSKMLVTTIKKELTYDEKKFLISFKKTKPKWDLIDIKGVNELPGVRWKLLNIEKMTRNQHLEALKKLENYINS